MNFFKKQSRFIIFFLITLIFLQSCRVYKRTPVTLEWAATEEKRVRIRMKNKKIYKFKRLGIEAGEYYGVKRNRGKNVRIPLYEKEIEYIRLHDKTWSVIFGIVTGVVVTYSVAIILFLIAWDGPNIGSINFSY